MKIRLLGGFAVEHDGRPVNVVGAMQRALLFRLALDPGSQLGYRAMAEDIWPDDPPENARAALQSLVSRLRSQLPPDTIESLPGGYRLALERGDVDAVRFQDLVAAASAPDSADPAALATEALELWGGEPWTPGDGYDWFERALGDDRATALKLGGRIATAVQTPEEPSIPAAITPLIGRDEELASVSGQLALTRLVTILGPGGAGKTRLAWEAARAARRPVVVELAPAGPDELLQAVLGAVGRQVRTVEGAGATAVNPRDRIVAALGGREVLLVLDNCEHLIDAAAETVADLLGALPRLRVLATSREPLGVPGEAFVPLGPLSPDAAEELFAERVQAARGTAPSADDDREVEAAARIRKRLDGLPLALELAAAKARTMTLDEIAEGLDDRFALLTGGLRTVLPRHQTLRALVDWSWSLLSEAERDLLSAISIYPAGVAAPDIVAVSAAHGSTRDVADALVDKSLVQRTAGRYRALETIREYGIEKLAESGRLEQRRLEQARWLGDASMAHDRLLRGPHIHDALAWFDAEDDNVVSALRFAADGGHGPEVVKIAGGNAWYWVIRDRNEDAANWLGVAAPFAAGGTTDEALMVRAVSSTVAVFGQAGEEFGDSPGAASHDGVDPRRFPEFDRVELEAIRVAARGSDNELLQIFPIMVEALTDSMDRGLWPTTVDVPAELLVGLLPWSRAVLNVMRAAMAQNRGDTAELGLASSDALILFEQVGDVWGLAISKQMRAEWLALDGQLEEALRISDESTAAMAEITSSWDLQQQQGLAVNLLFKLGRIDEALARAQALLESAREAESPRALMLALCTSIFLAVRLEDRDRATELLAELDANGAELPSSQRQVLALDAMARASVAQLHGDWDVAEQKLRIAAEAAVASGDNPVMASVALGIASLSVDRGELGTAATALDLAIALRGAPDPYDPLEQRVASALAADAETRPSLDGSADENGRAPVDRDSAAETLAQILRR